MKQILRDAKIWLGPHELTGDTNAVALDDSAALVDQTTLGHLSRVRAGGLHSVSARVEGLWEAGPGVDDILFARVGAAGVPVSIAPVASAPGQLAYTFLCTIGEYAPGGAVGESLAFSVAADSSDRLVRGTLTHNAAVSATGNGTALDLGAVASGQALYAALHVLQLSGTTPSLTVKLQSDSDAGFVSPTDQISFAPLAAVGSEWKLVPGPLTDTWFRAQHTVAGTGVSAKYVLVVGTSTGAVAAASVSVIDTYTRATVLAASDSGHTPIASGGATWEIFTNSLRCAVAGGGGSLAYDGGTGFENATFHLRFTTADAGKSMMRFRFTNVSDHWVLWITMTPQWQLAKNVAGVFTAIQTLATPVPAAGDRVSVSYIGNEIKLFDTLGAQMGTTTTDAAHNTVRPAGPAVSSDAVSSTHRFDDLTITKA